MAGKRRHPSSRDRLGHRLAFGLIVVVAGRGAGALLAFIVIGQGLSGKGAGSASFADLSANPKAAVADATSSPPCLECADSYGVGARLRAERESRLSEPFRRLGEVNEGAAPSPPEGTDDDYRYGGRFPDLPRPAMVIPVALPPVAEAGPPPDGQRKGPDATPEPSENRD